METVQTFGTLPVLEAERTREVHNGFESFQDEEYETDWAAWNLRNALDAEDDPILLPCYDYDEQGYLISDGLPMAEYEPHRDTMFYVIAALKVHFAPRAQEVYVSGNNFLHYRRGDRTRHISPDCYVVFGVKQRTRMNYKSWEEGDRLPSFVLEVTSKKTQETDAIEKYALYEQTLGVREYVRFDPFGDYLHPPLQGYTLAEGVYEPMPYEPDGRLYSVELDLYLETQDARLRLYDAKSGEYLRTFEESERERVQERERADAEAAGRREERRRAEAERRRANAAETLATEERKARETERARAEKALAAQEAELARLRAELEAFRKSAGS